MNYVMNAVSSFYLYPETSPKSRINNKTEVVTLRWMSPDQLSFSEPPLEALLKSQSRRGRAGDDLLEPTSAALGVRASPTRKQRRPIN